MYKDIHVKYPLFLYDFSETLNFPHRFSKKILKYKFQENPASVSRFVPIGRTEGRTD